MKQLTWGKIAFALLLLYWFPGNPRKLFAQATAGFTQVGDVQFGTNTFVDTTVTAGSFYQYEVLSHNIVGVSVPSNIVTTAQIPTGTGAHSATLTWTPPAAVAGVTPPADYQIFRMLVTLPNPPVVSSTVTVASAKPAATNNNEVATVRADPRQKGMLQAPVVQ